MRLRLSLHTWLLLTHLSVLTLPVLSLLGTGALAKDLRAQTQEDLEHQGTLLAMHAAWMLRQGGERATIPQLAPALEEMLEEAKSKTLAGFRVVDATGVVVASSASSGWGKGDDLSGTPEVAAALDGEVGVALKPRDNSNSRQTPLSSVSRRANVRVQVAIPIQRTEGGPVEGAMVLSRTPREETQALYQMAPRLLIGSVVSLFITMFLAFGSSVVLSRSLRRLSGAAARIAAGAVGSDEDLDRARASHVAETGQLASALATMRDRLQARLAYIAEFAGNVSHEFKTPVTTLRGTLELLRDDEEMPPAQRARFLDNALAELDRLSGLVGGLLRLARAEQGGVREPVELLALAESLQPRHPSLRVEGGPVWVEGSREQLEAVLENLIRNAEVHGPEEGGAPVTVTVRVSKVRRGVGSEGIVEVEDNGRGISEANLPRVWDRFFTTRRSEGGTGLGLALVKAIVQTHGGQIEVQSRPGETCFRVRLPGS